MPHLDDIFWYVGRARAEGAHSDLHGGQRSSEVKWGKLCAMATIIGQKKRWCKLRMMMTFMEVKGHQRSNMVTCMPWLPYLVKRIADDLHGGQRSSEVKCGKVRAMAPIFGQKSCWCKLRMMMMTFVEVKGQQRSNIVNFATWLSNLVRSTADASLGWLGPSWRSKVNRGQI